VYTSNIDLRLEELFYSSKPLLSCFLEGADSDQMGDQGNVRTFDLTNLVSKHQQSVLVMIVVRRRWISIIFCKDKTTGWCPIVRYNITMLTPYPSVGRNVNRRICLK
jgi:hypothetical protein